MNRRRKTSAPRGPQAIGNILTELMAQRGFGQAAGLEQMQEAWVQAAGPDLAPFTRVGGLNRGKLEIVVASSVWLQELNYVKAELLKKLAAQWQGAPPRDLRFRVGSIR